jgi:RNA polymerase sigma-70 factor (ECF subfamily)
VNQFAATDIEQVYRLHGHSVLRRAREILGDDHEAREALQEIFISLLDRPDQFQGRSAISTWLYSATTHLCLNKLRNRNNRSRLIDLNIKPLTSSETTGGAEERAAARQILSRVPEELARVAVYYYFDEMTHAEIAEVIGCSRRQVGNLLARFHELARDEGDSK